jgi:DNA-binding response OmpR family regulator
MEIFLDVLLVEDDRPTSRLLRRLLESVGMNVTTVETVADALREVQFAPSLIVLDLMLPDGSGIEVLRAVREQNLACKVAVVSAWNDGCALAAATDLKADAIFSKPLDFEDFVDWISSIFTEDPVEAFRIPA